MAETTSTDVVETTEAQRPPVHDHKPKAKKKDNRKAAALGEDLTIEFAGSEWTVAASALDDFELLEDLDALDSGNPARLPKVLRRMLGDDQYKRALDALRDGNGRVSVEKGAEFFTAVMTQANPNS